VPPVNGTTYSYPLPARGTVNLAFDLSLGADVRIEVVNSAGSLVTVLNGRLAAGTGALTLDLSGFANGVYYYSAKLTFDDGSVKVLKPSTFVVVP
jgi:hypothetical protein